jgi:ribosome-associated toxin RatA of RatAB toxin-antitoxin module
VIVPSSTINPTYMPAIQSTRFRTLPFPASAVWPVIADVAAYPAWWPSSAKVRVLQVMPGLLGSRLEIRPYGGQPFVCTVDGVDAPRSLRTAYSGIYSGSGTWTLDEDSSGQTRVGYGIDLRIESRFIRLLARILPVTALHDRLTDAILEALAKRVAETAVVPSTQA